MRANLPDNILRLGWNVIVMRMTGFKLPFDHVYPELPVSRPTLFIQDLRLITELANYCTVITVQ